jgi:hypothetical protein
MAKPIVTNQIPVACFAPPLTDEKLSEYKSLILGLGNGPVKDAMSTCMEAVEVWWELPESTRTDASRFETVHRGKRATYTVTPLEVAHMDDETQSGALWQVVPYEWELKGIRELFDAIPTSDKAVRDAAFHLWWYVMELCNSREPLTQEALPSGEALAALPDAPTSKRVPKVAKTPQYPLERSY